MKQIYIPAIMLIVAMGSCAQNDTYFEDVTSDVEDLVTLNVATGITRGTDVTTTTLESSTSGVKLHINDSDKINDKYDFTASGSDWSQSTTSLEWGDITLPAHFYSMHDGTSKELNVTDESATHDYSVSGASTTHKDLVYSATKLSAIPAGGTINVFHKHALSKIHIYAATGTNKVYIAQVNVVNYDGDGTVTIASVGADELSTATGVTWSNGDSSEETYQYYYIGNYDTTVEATPTALVSTTSGSVIINSDGDAPMMVIPQTTTATTRDQITSSTGTIENTYIEIIYYMTDTEDMALVGYSSVAARPDASTYIESDQDKVLYVKGAFPLGHTFLENKEYDITLGLGICDSSGGILLEDNYVDRDGNAVSLTNKITEETTTPEIPEIDKGDDILGDADDDISIIVTVLDWEDGTDHTIN